MVFLDVLRLQQVDAIRGDAKAKITGVPIRSGPGVDARPLNRRLRQPRFRGSDVDAARSESKVRTNLSEILAPGRNARRGDADGGIGSAICSTQRNLPGGNAADWIRMPILRQ